MSARALQQLSGRATPIGDGRMSAQRSAAASPHLHHRSAASSPHLHAHGCGEQGEDMHGGAMDKLLDCERAFAALKREGRHLDALPYMETSVFLRKQIYGANSREVLKACQVFTTSCNTLAMNCLQKDDYMKAYELLKKAELLTEPRGYLTDDKARLKLRAVTFNNLGCFYKRRGKLHAALQYLDKALKIELASDEVDNPAGTHLNLCATLSQLGRHQPALEHAQCALDLLKQGLSRKGALHGGAGGKAGEEASIVAIAYHNLAVEQEHLGQWAGALQSYGESVAMAERQWGPEHPKTHAIRHSYQQAKEKLARKGGRLPALRGGLPPKGGAGSHAATIGVGAHNGKGALDPEGASATYGQGSRHTTLPSLGGKLDPRNRGGATSVPPLGTHGALGAGSAPVTPPAGKRPALRIPQQSYNSAPVSSRGWGGGCTTGGVVSHIGASSATGPPGAGIMGGRHSSLGHTYGANQPLPYGANQPLPYGLSPYGTTTGGGSVRFDIDSAGGPRSRALEEDSEVGYHGGGMAGASKTGPRTPGKPSATKKRPSNGGGAAHSRALEDEYDDLSAPVSPQRGGAGGTAGVAQFPQHVGGVSAAHFPPAVTAQARSHDSGVESAGMGKKKGERAGGGTKSQQELLARVAQLEASLSAMGGGSIIGSQVEWKGEFKAKCHMEDDVRVLLLQRNLKLAELAQTVADEYGPGVRIKYNDGEGDLVTITTDKGLRLALSDHFASGADVWHLHLFTAQSPSKPAPGGGGGEFFVGGGNDLSAAAAAAANQAQLEAAGKPWEDIVGKESAGGKVTLNAKAKQRQASAAIKIQAVQRGHRARVEFRVMKEHDEEARAEQHAAEQAARSEDERNEEREREAQEAEKAQGDAQNLAATKMPVVAAANKPVIAPAAEESDQDDDNADEEMSAEDLAALDIQRVFRGHVRRKRLRFDQRREQLQGGAGTLITKVVRGHLARKLFLQMLLVQLRHKSAMNIQRIVRGNAARKRDRARRALESKKQVKALRLQSVYRGHMSRVYAQRLRFKGAGGVILNRYQLDPSTLSRKQKEDKAARDARRAAGKEGPGEAEYVAATCLKTNKAVLIRYISDVHALNKEVALHRFLGADHVAPIFEVHSDTKFSQHVLVFPKPDKQLDVMLAKKKMGQDGKMKTVEIDSVTKTEVIVGVSQALQAVHSKRVAICNLTAAKVVKYGKVWKILGLELAHKEGEIFGNRIMVPGAPQLLSGIVWSPENSCDTPESVAAWATKTEDALKASTRLDLWNLGALTYRLLASKPLFSQPKDVAAALDPKNLLVGKEFECDMDKVYDVMGKYLLENLLCLHPADRMPSKDVALYAAQIGSQADFYGQIQSSDDEDANIAMNDLKNNGWGLDREEDANDDNEPPEDVTAEGAEGEGEAEEVEEDEEGNVEAFHRMRKRQPAAAAASEGVEDDSAEDGAKQRADAEDAGAAAADGETGKAHAKHSGAETADDGALAEEVQDAGIDVVKNSETVIAGTGEEEDKGQGGAELAAGDQVISIETSTGAAEGPEKQEEEGQDRLDLVAGDDSAVADTTLEGGEVGGEEEQEQGGGGGVGGRGGIGCKLVERNKGITQTTSWRSRTSARVTVL